MATTRGARPVSCECRRTTGMCCPRQRSDQRSRASHCVFSRLWSPLAACECVMHSGHICPQGHSMLPHCTLGHMMSGMGANSRLWGSTNSEEFRGSVATVCFPQWPQYENGDITIGDIFARRARETRERPRSRGGNRQRPAMHRGGERQFQRGFVHPRRPSLPANRGQRNHTAALMRPLPQPRGPEG